MKHCKWCWNDSTKVSFNWDLCTLCASYLTEKKITVLIEKLDLPDNAFDNWYIPDIVDKLNEIIDYLNNNIK